ncbi:MAG: 50S ribosomal protein L21 [Planctomycetes bacterium]|nr:50S ribosomal protein L21 [Planctomycetota bacterium]
MYAIVRDRSRCLTLSTGLELWVDHMSGAEVGSDLVFDQVQLMKKEDGSVEVGTPCVEGASVVAEVLGDEKDKKIYVQHFRRRKSSRDRNGHRQTYTRIRVKEIRG